MSAKLELMKKELSELQKTCEEWQNETREITRKYQEWWQHVVEQNYQDRKGPCNMHVQCRDGSTIREYQLQNSELSSEREKTRAALQSKIECLERRIFVREEALDLLQEVEAEKATTTVKAVEEKIAVEEKAELLGDKGKVFPPGRQMAIVLLVATVIYQFLILKKRVNDTDILPLSQPDILSLPHPD